MGKERDILYLELDEVISLARSMNNLRDKLIVFLLYETGCSITELINLKIKNILKKEKKIIIEESVRTNEKRIVEISKELLDIIKKYLIEKKSNSEFILSSRQSKNMTQKRIQQIISSYKLSSGKKITPQILRYTHIAQAYSQGVAINNISKQVGLHRSRAIEIFSQLKDNNNTYSRFIDNNPITKVMNKKSQIRFNKRRD